MSKPTSEQVAAEWKALRRLKKHIPRFDRYRVDRHAMISAQVETLSGDLTLKEIKRRWDTDKGGDARGAAEDALYWKQGGPVPSPVEMWKPLAIETHPSETPIKQGVL